MSDIHRKSLLALSQEDYKRDLAALTSAIERNDVVELQKRKNNSFGAALHKRVCGPGKSVRVKPA